MANATRNASVAHSASRSWNSRSSEASPPTTISVQLAASASIAFPLFLTPPAADWFTSFIGTFDADVQCEPKDGAAQGVAWRRRGFQNRKVSARPFRFETAGRISKRLAYGSRRQNERRNSQ